MSRHKDSAARPSRSFRRGRARLIPAFFVVFLTPAITNAEVITCGECAANDLLDKTELTIDWSVVVGTNKVEFVCVGSLHSWSATVYGPSSGITTEPVEKAMTDAAVTCTAFFGDDEIHFSLP